MLEVTAIFSSVLPFFRHRGLEIKILLQNVLSQRQCKPMAVLQSQAAGREHMSAFDEICYKHIINVLFEPVW